MTYKTEALVVLIILTICNINIAEADCGQAIIFSTLKLDVDADGAPNAYLVDGKGLSFTCDGVAAIENGKKVTVSDDANWQKKCNSAWKKAKQTGNYSKVAIFGFLTDKNNKPLIEGNAYISTTFIHIPPSNENSQNHWVNSLRIPYVVLSKEFVKKHHVEPGDIAIVYRKKTQNYAFAIYADKGSLGEASIKLHEDIGNNPFIIKNGVQRAKSRIEDEVITFIFPKKTTTPIVDSTVWYDEIQQIGKQALSDFGGIEKLKTCSEAVQ